MTETLTPTRRKPWNVLLVEDNPGDVRFICDAFQAIQAPVRIDVVGDGEEAMAYLRHEGTHVESRTPDLVLLDLNLPLMSGREVLASAKEDPALKHVPILVLSGSTNEDDVRRAYDLHANSYITKPMKLTAFRDIARHIAEFWLETASLPAP